MDTQTIIKPATLEEAFGDLKTTTIIENYDKSDDATLVLKRVNTDGSRTILNYPNSENIDETDVLLPSKINEVALTDKSINDRDTKLFIPKPFIEANTQEVQLFNLKNDCVIPVFSKDNEKTIAHFEFINITQECIAKVFPHHSLDKPEIRVSHQIKGRTPDAIHKNVKDLLDHERTQYFERMAFIIRMWSHEISLHKV